MSSVPEHPADILRTLKIKRLLIQDFRTLAESIEAARLTGDERRTMTLRIRDEQFDAFLPQTDDERIDFIVAHLRDDVPELLAGLPDDSVRDMARNGMARARSHGLEALGDLTAFVSIMFEIAPDFDEHPRLRQALGDPSLPPAERFDRLFAPQYDQAWEEAARYTSARQRAEAWFPELKEEQD